MYGVSIVVVVAVVVVVNILNSALPYFSTHPVIICNVDTHLSQ